MPVETALEIVIDTSSPTPPFEQLRTQIATLTAHGELPPGSKLPTVRQLAADLGLAANTVARSYRELEADGVIVTAGRRGTFVHQGTHAADSDAALTELAESFVKAARRAGLSEPEAARMVEDSWRKG
ncbi:MAG: GntR family transcriptional regulator [Propionibacteriaceae bacterium]